MPEGRLLRITILITGLFTALISSALGQSDSLTLRPPVPDIGTFMKIGGCGVPGIAPDGTIFFESSMSGAPQLYRLTKEGWPYQLTVFDDGIDWYELSPDGFRAIIGASTGGSEQSQMYLLEARSGQIQPLTDNPSVQFGSPLWRKDGSGFYFRSNIEKPGDFRVYFHDLKTGRNDKIFDMDGTNYLAGLSPDGKHLLISHSTSNSNNDLYLLDLTTHRADLLTAHDNDALYDSPYIMPDNQTVYLLSNANKYGVIKRARLDLSSKKLEFIDPDSKWTIEGLKLSDNRRYMVWLVNEEGYSRMHLWDIEKQTELSVPNMKGLVSALALTDNGQVLFAFTSPVRTQDVWFWDGKAEALTMMTHSIYAGVNPDIFTEPRLIKYESFDGLEIPAFIYLPPNYDGRPIPFIVQIHGGPENQFRPYFQRNFQYFLQNGYGILAPNVRGSSGYGREYQNLDNYRNRLNSIKDIRAGVDYLIKNNYSKVGLIGIRGGSYGGYAVLAAITEYPDLFSAAIDEVGIANFVTYLINTKDYRRHLREAEYGPLEDSAFLATISPIHKADLIKTPLLVVHGMNDPRVPIDEARQIIKAIQARGGAVDSLIFPDEGHAVSKQSNNLILYRKVVEFFDTYLKKE